jgi:dTDP-4-amino-4,6-dideoxygalactose transaminase
MPVIEEPEIDAVVNCFRRPWIGTGPRVQEFEKDFAAFTGSRHAIALNSCTAALHLVISGGAVIWCSMR